MGAINYGPSGVPAREDPEIAVDLLVAGGYTACEIDFEGGFWMDWDWAAEFGRRDREGSRRGARRVPPRLPARARAGGRDRRGRRAAARPARAAGGQGARRP